ncbi:MAG: peptide-methionine (S)-S-oxide reductase [Anaerolineae bacterium]|nr:peptide-methionine (S)-S-oxide reductase [Anaerolineae bacterium]
MIRTRVGYAGGEKENPTYEQIGDHSETVQIDYDPAQITYAELLEVYWQSHSPTSRPWSRQYASVIFYHDEEQRRLAEESRDRLQAELGKPIYTEIVPYSKFYLAEGYHQKYQLRHDRELMAEFRAIYPDESDFIDSTAAARVNGYVAGNGTLAELQAIVEDLGLSPEARQKLLDKLSAGRP